MQTAPGVAVATVLFVLLILMYLAGRKVRSVQIARDPAFGESNLSAVNGTLLGILGLLLAFAFSMSNSRFDSRRELIVKEANAIGTVVLRTEAFPDSIRRELREDLRLYVESRIDYFATGMDVAAILGTMKRSDSLSKMIWKKVMSYTRTPAYESKVLTSEIIPALNDMIDIVTTRRSAGEATIPDSIMYFLLLLCLTSAFLLGYDHQGPLNWVIIGGFAFMLSVTVLMIIDLDRPRSGLIRMDSTNQRIVDLRGLFNQ